MRCSQDICRTCDTTNTSICLECVAGATLVSGVCQRCPPNCATCSLSTPPVCFSCINGFSISTVNNVTSCVPCGKGCMKCSDSDATVCLQCQPGTYLNTTNATCLRCKQGCKECSSFEVCTVSSPGVVVIAGSVVTCRPGCKTCDQANPDSCSECQPRFILVSGVCQNCGPLCEVCSSTSVCTQCAPNAILSGGSCSICQGNCATCSSSNLTSCSTCKRGFSLVNNTCVRQCQRGCLLCDATNSSICLTCLQGNALRQNGQCVKCLGSCSGSCDPRNISMCISCVDGFQLLNNECVRCPPGCATCLNGDCSTCVPGFTLVQNSTGSFVCQENCRPPCASCNKDTCLQCENGFTLSGNQCTPDFSCNPNCAFCPQGTEKLVNGSCVPCPSNCSSCTSGVCHQCKPGNYLNGSTCNPCNSQCRTCFTADSCDECARGFVKEILSMDETIGVSSAVYSDKCIPCDPNCLTCQVEPDRCTSCPDGNRLFSSRCAGMFTVVYQYELNVNYSDFLQNSQSDTFVNAISAASGVNSNDTYITSVREGSTIVGGTLSSSSQSNANTIQSSLSSSLTGFTVLSSSATVYYGTDPYTPPADTTPGSTTITPVNIGLIVGVVVGGVVFIAILVVIIYKCKKASAQAVTDATPVSQHEITNGVVVEKY